jgi:acetoin utilization deacetylase AcuC-like enzyme
MRERAMGFCYLNSAAAAALTVARNGHRVAIWDFDAHHGNGTEDMVMGAMRVQFASVHQFPGYPGTGEVSSGNCFNYPVAPYTPPEEHLEICRQSLQKLLQEHPQLLVVSAGFDAYHGDPLTQMSLRVEDFYTLGTWVKDCGIPAAAVLEGGYSPELPQLVEAFVKGWRGL